MSRPSIALREFLEQNRGILTYEQYEQLEAIERSVLRREGRYDGLVIGRDYQPADNDELTATKAHLEDMRRIIFEEKS